MLNNWKDIWNKRSSEADEINLQMLIQLDGYDGGAGKIHEKDWRVLTKRLGDKLEIKAGDSVFEVGSGSGAFLYSLMMDFDIKVGGIDFSAGLTEVARNIIPKGNFIMDEAINLSESPKYDHVISNGVFHYFDLNYAQTVINTMIKKAVKKIGIFEVPDLASKKELESIRRSTLSKKEYDKKYANLKHTYYSKDWFMEIARKYDLSVTVFDGCVPNYAQNDYRFNVILSKK